MDARSFQHHAAAVAELTDALLAERAADKAARALGAKADSSRQNCPEAFVSSSADPSSAGPPDRAPSTSPGTSSCGHTEAAQSSTLMSHHITSTHEKARDAEVNQQSTSSLEGNNSDPAASSSAPILTGRNLPSLPPSAERSAGSLGRSRGLYYCTVCSVSTTSAVHLQTHYMGSKHQRRLAQSQGSNSDEAGPHYCPICAINATSAVHLQLHLSGRAHQRKAKLAAETSAEAGGSQQATAALDLGTDPGKALQVAC